MVCILPVIYFHMNLIESETPKLKNSQRVIIINNLDHDTNTTVCCGDEVTLPAGVPGAKTNNLINAQNNHSFIY